MFEAMMLAGIPVRDADVLELARLLREAGGVLLQEHEWRIREGLG